MSLLWTILIGLLAGALAKFLMPGKDPGGIVVTMLLGIVGAVVMTFLGQMLGLYQPGQKAGFLGAVVGAVLILAIFRQVKKKK